MSSDIGEIRRRIDAIDEQIQGLIDDRARLAREVGANKQASAAVDFYRPEREAEVLRNVLARNRGPLKNEEMLRLFREIMSACLAQQEPLKVAFLGPEGTYTHAAVTRHFGHSVRALPLPDVEDVFREVEAGSADFGVVPIENSTEGTVHHTLDMFMTSPLKICGEVAAQIYGLESIVAEIEDRPDNTTRFHIVGRALLASSGRDKTTILMSIADTESPGALHRLPEPLARFGVSMTRIESRPSRQRKWHYVFFVDLEGHAEDTGLAAALAELEGIASLFKVLGAYPCSIEAHI